MSRSAPEAWKIFSDKLIPIEEAIMLPSVPQFAGGAKEPETEWLVKHTMIRVEKGGASLMVSQKMRKLLKISAKEDFSTTTVEYVPDLEKVHIVRARTILPDGTIIPVGKEGVFLEQVGRDNDTSFSDQKRIRIVFPKTDPGAIIEIVVVRESQPRIPKHWNYESLWKGLSPVRSHKVLVDIPSKMEDKLVWELIGADIKPKREVLADGLLRFTWEEKQISDIRFQLAMPNPWQRGPILRIGLGASWEAFALWYGGLIQEVNEDVSALDSLSREWAGDASDPRGIASNLFDKVSRDIRYTGLEFGKGAFQPRSPQDVSDTRYGDCKDKANLLKVLLSVHGISSRIALINTRFKGEIPRAVSTARLFNHAILAVEIPGEDKLVFCDPTLNGIPFGSLILADQGRDVFLVNEDGSFDWERTREDEPPSLQIDADLSLDPSGGFSGWFDVKIGGPSGWLVSHQYEQQDRQAKLNDGLKYFFSMIPGIHILDVEKVVSSDKEAAPFHYRFYAIQTVPLDDESAKILQIKFPVSRHLITTIGPNELRLHSFLMPPYIGAVSLSMLLPEGWNIIDQPAEWAADLEGYQLNAQWKLEGRRLQGNARLERQGVELSTRQHKELADSVRSFAAWLDKPVLLSRPVSKSEYGGSQYDPMALPKLPSAEGFSALVQLRFPFDAHFPEEADHKARIMAFKRMQEMYPKDEDLAQFIGKTMELCSRMFDYPSEDEVDKIAKQAKGLMQHYEGKIANEKVASIELLLIAALLESGESEAAIEMSEALLERNVPEIVKQIASGLLGSMILVDEPERAVGLFRVGLKNQLMPDEEWLSLATGLLDCVALLPGNSEKQIEAQMITLATTWPERREELKETFLSNPELLVDYGHHEEARMFLRALESSKLQYTDDELEPLKEVFSRLDELTPHLQKITDYLEDQPWPNFKVVEEGDVIESATDCMLAFNDDLEVSFRYALRGLVGFGTQATFSDQLIEVLYEAENWFESAKGDPDTLEPPASIEPLLDLLVSVLKKVPDGDDFYSGRAFIAEGDLIGRRKGVVEEEVFFLSVATDESRESSYRFQAIGRIQEIREEEGDIDRYLESLAMVEPLLEEVEWGYQDVLLGAYLSLAHGNFEEAWRRFDLVVDADSDDFSGKAHQLAEALIKNREVSEAWWKRTQFWWKKWQVLADKMKVNSEPRWSLYKPWERISKKAIKRVESIKDKKKKKRQLKKMMAKQIEFSRWHESGIKDVRKLLNLTLQVFPQFKDEIAQLLVAIETH